MADAVADEIEDLVDQAEAQDDSEDDSAEEEKVDAKPKRVRKTGGSRRRKKKGAKKDDDESTASSGPAKTLEEMDVDELLPQGLPAPEQNIKGLGDLYAKYGVGERPEFKVHLYRTYPKIAPGGVKFDGFYDEYDIPLTEQQVQADYGGGQYRIAVIGPHPTNPRLPKTYGSHSIGLAGEPNWERMPRALQGKKAASTPDTSGNPPPHPMMPSHENPKLAEAALKMFEKSAEAEREERRRLEAKMDAASATRSAGSEAVAEAERRRADDLIRAERERAESERSYMEKRMEEIKRETEEQRRRFESEVRSRPSFGEELRNLAPLLSRDDGTAKAMLEQILGKHRDEVAAINSAHQEFVRSLREGHQSELAALRSAHARELEAERQASRSREERIEERLRAEREERERDRVRHKEAMDDRDRHWKDRMEGALQTQQSSWESRHQMLVSTHETTTATLRADIDRLKSENYELRQKADEKGDIFSQLGKFRELQTVMKEFSGDSSSSSSSSGGIGLSQSAGDEWKQTLAEGLTERAPQIMEKLFGTGGAVQQTQQPTPQQMQSFHEGQVVDTPQGKMEVVRNPADGQLALAPKEALDRHRAAVKAHQEAQGGGGGLLPSQGQQPSRRRSHRSNGRSRRRSRGVPSAVPNLGDSRYGQEPLKKQVPPWEAGLDDEDDVPPAPPPPPPVPRAATRKPEPAPSKEPIELNAMERQALKLIAKEVHESVQVADEPEEFVQKMLQKYPANVLQQIAGGYTDRQIAQGIVQLEPNSAGATPAGKQFVLRAFGMLREAVSS